MRGTNSTLRADCKILRRFRPRWLQLFSRPCTSRLLQLEISLPERPEESTN